MNGGQRYGDKGYFIEPTLFTNVKDDMRIAKEEIFGPVLSVLKFSDVDEIARRANATNFGLAAAVWTRDIAKAHRFAHKLAGRHGVGELLRRVRCRGPVRRLQGKRLGPRTRRSRSGCLHRVKDGDSSDELGLLNE